MFRKKNVERWVDGVREPPEGVIKEMAELVVLQTKAVDRQETADYLDYSLGAVKKWITGERVLPDDVIAKMAGLNDLINKNANRIANKLIVDGTEIDDRTIHFIEGNLLGLPDLPSGGAKDACIARAVLIVAAERMKKKSKTPQKI